MASNISSFGLAGPGVVSSLCWLEIRPEPPLRLPPPPPRNRGSLPRVGLSASSFAALPSAISPDRQTRAAPPSQARSEPIPPQVWSCPPNGNRRPLAGPLSRGVQHLSGVRRAFACSTAPSESLRPYPSPPCHQAHRRQCLSHPRLAEVSCSRLPPPHPVQSTRPRRSPTQLPASVVANRYCLSALQPGIIVARRTGQIGSRSQ